MKIYMMRFLTVFSAIFMISCNNGNNENIIVEDQNPVALQEKSSLARFSKPGGNLVDALYQELVEKKPELNSLETELNNFATEANKTQNIFYNYNEKSQHFYEDATFLANQIKDSVAQIKILEIIKLSSDKYDQQSNELNHLVEKIANNQKSINDSHTILKLLLTIPVIEKFQEDNLPKNKDFQKVIVKQEQLNKKILDKTPN
ncbi:hypothetical protein HNQ02_002783 [Flavobacterium sp. 7E]|uniref:hypothetical protein n=1 Tax=Flavobacterium sp. 7E TaxID=2735898 RepID=UPI00156F4994|nr:hypothetical protein [Flavobacterium sp. 7E]NRS89849.1 hypothetical protein [Flavobacterium sp. 7E]